MFYLIIESVCERERAQKSFLFYAQSFFFKNVIDNLKDKTLWDFEKIFLLKHLSVMKLFFYISFV